MAAKTWAFSDLEGVKKGGVASLSLALLNRLVREAAAAFDAPNGAIVLDVDPVRRTEAPVVAAAVVRFEKLDLAWGRPSVAVRVEQHDDRLSVQIGAAPGTAALGYQYEFGWAEETPPALLTALFSCALESIRTNKELR